MGEFLKGTMGVFLQIILLILGIVLFIASFVSCGNDSMVTGGILLVLGILCFCAMVGIRYWLGHIVRMK